MEYRNEISRSGERMDKYQFSERDICTKLITPAILRAGWQQQQFREEVKLTDGRVMVRGRLAARVCDPRAKGGPKRADLVLYARPDLPIAVVEAKQAKFPLGHGMPQALAYAEMLDAPFAISSNGSGFLLHDRTGLTQPTERELALDGFPSLDDLLPLYRQWKGITTADAIRLVEQPFHTDGSGKKPRYYQRVAINRSIEAIARGQQRVLLVMATGTGKTYTAFQIIWRLWKAKAKKRILFLADRNILVDQTMQQDFAPFGEVMHKITNREARKNHEVYLALYQAVTGKEEWKQIYREFPADFFDLVVIDECHCGSAAELAVANVQREYFKLDALKFIEIVTDELPKYHVQEGDLLIIEGRDWDKVGRTTIWKGGIENCLHQNYVFKARIPRSQLLEKWAELVFNSRIGQDYFASASKQTTNLASINMAQLRSFPLPIPPSDEQQRILILTALSIFMDRYMERCRQLGHKQKLSPRVTAAIVSVLTHNGIRTQCVREPEI
jgi:hypothetical protein